MNKILGLLFLMLSGLAAAQAEGKMPLAEYFGFGPMEIIKIDPDIAALQSCDFNSDGLMDLAVLNNRKSRIEVLLRRKHPETDENLLIADTDNINELPGSAMYDSRPLLITVRPASLAAADLNSDGRPDLAFYGVPAGLYVYYQDEPEDQAIRWKSVHKIRIDDGLTKPGTFACGDLNGDARNDLVLAGEDSLYLIFQNEQGQLEEPQTLGIEGKITEVRLRDLNGDGLTDLLFLIDGRERPIQVRFATGDGLFSPLVQFESEPPVSLKAADIDGDSKDEILFIEKRTGRLMGLKLESAKESQTDVTAPSGILTFPTNSDAGAGNLVSCDLNGDNRRDLVISRPQEARVSVYLQTKDKGIARPVEYPAFSNIEAIAAADVDGDGQDEIAFLSIQERVVGISRFEDGRLEYPKALPLTGEPVAMDLADIDSDGNIECIYLSRNREDQRQLYFYEFNSNGIDLSKTEPILIKSILSNPSGMRTLDVDADGLGDILIFQLYDDPVLLVQQPDHKFEIIQAATAQGGLIKGGSPRSLVSADVDGDGIAEALIALQNFARTLLFKEGKWQILDQYNAAGRNDQILAARAIDVDHDGQKEIVLLEGRRNRLQILKAGEDKTYRIEQQIDLAGIEASERLTMEFGNFRGAGDELVIFDGKKFILVPVSQINAVQYRLQPLFTTETAVRDGRYADVAAGDLNADDVMDLALVEFARNHLEILTFPPDSPKPVLGTRFQVFEEKSYAQRLTRAGAEPREILIADLNGSGTEDLAVVIHDRIIIYPQDP